MDLGGGGGESGMYGESNTGTYATMCKPDSQCEFPARLGSNQGPEIAQRGGVGREAGGGASVRDATGEPVAAPCWCLVQTNATV